MTYAEVERLVADLPLSARETLREGPRDEPDCRVCTALLILADRSPAAESLLSFHEEPPATEVGNVRCYARCLLIYRAAGWRPNDERGPT